MKKLYVDYDSEIVTENKTVDSRFCNSIMFENIGDDDAVIDTAIPLNFADKERWFENDDPSQEIRHKFKVQFTTVVNPKILVIRKYIKEC